MSSLHKQMAMGALLACAALNLSADESALPQVLVTRQLAELRELAVGDVVTLSRDADGTRSGEFRIVGLYEPLPDPMRLTAKRYEVRLHLPELLDLTVDPDQPQAREAVDAINVRLRDPERGQEFVSDVTLRMPTLAVASTASGGAYAFVVLERFHLAIALVTVLGSTAFLLALMVMRADERRETVGILRLIGFSKPRVLVEVLLEGLLIAVLGSLFGVVFAAGMEGLINLFFQHRYDTALVFVRVTGRIAWQCVALAVPLGVLAGIVASWHLLRRDIVALLRR